MIICWYIRRKNIKMEAGIWEKKLCDGIRDSNIEPICGRPLGLKFNTQTCLLYITDAYFGLLVVGPNGDTVIKLAILAKGVPFKFTNGLDIDTSTGMVYFTDSSILFQRRDADFFISSSARTGRLLKYNPYTRDVFVLYDGLAFPNGVALSANNSFILVNESIKKRILKFNMPRVLNYIKRNKNGSRRLGIIENDAPDPIKMKFNEEAKVLKILDGKGAPTFKSISEVKE
ncbi:protein STRICTOSIDINE SYNTHASE-LIKE 10 [Gossypium hirsutum]|uniref:Protein STRICTOSIDINE SYNTHASE-LIKE 10 n=2 Tax=Gossypium TaxID=3633 RepID=A0ABM3AX83_GOSHI|nr:protein STRICTOSIDINE SYNTHASE-LIKE 10-like [Gossypium hirsutum]